MWKGNSAAAPSTEDGLPVEGAEVIDRKALEAGERIPDLVAAVAAGDERELRSEAQPDMPARLPLEQGGQAPAIGGGRLLADYEASGSGR